MLYEAKRLAFEADCDERTAVKAIKYGAAAVRGRPGERLAGAARKLNIALGTDSQPQDAARVA